jgi:hypothetical protein
MGRRKPRLFLSHHHSSSDSPAELFMLGFSDGLGAAGSMTTWVPRKEHRRYAGRGVEGDWAVIGDDFCKAARSLVAQDQTPVDPGLRYTGVRIGPSVSGKNSDHAPGHRPRVKA